METKDTSSRSWFVVLPNPTEHYKELENKSEKDICEFLAKKWLDGGKNRSGAWLYCVSADGLHHVHIVLESKQPSRFSAVKKAYDKAHIEPTQGNKEQVEDYINKRGKFEEKGEKILYKYQVGELIGKQGKRSDLANIKELIESGLTPTQIREQNPDNYRLSEHIDKMFFDYKLANTACIRDVKVYWHFGETATGKSYECFKHMQEKGRDKVYFCSGEQKNPFDCYQAQEEIWIDELRETSQYFNFPTLLSVCDKYTAPLSARYCDKLQLWNEVHITSPLLPAEVFPYGRDKHDKLQQLNRRITAYIYHYIDSSGAYKQFEFIPQNSKDTVLRDTVLAECAIAIKNQQKNQFTDFVEIYNPDKE